MVNAWMANMSSPLFCNSQVTGLIALAGAAICSPIICGMMMLGAALALLFYMALGMPQDDSYTFPGLMAFNGVLACIALGGNFLVLKGQRVWVNIVLGTFVACFATAGMTALFAPLGIPPLGLPLNIAVWSSLFCAQGVDDLVATPL